MLNIINNLEFFFEDCYRRISVREYAKLIKVSPPTASKILSDYEKEGILKKEIDRQYFFYFANKNNEIFIDFSRIYWKRKLFPLINQLEKELTNHVIILFGSLAKAEVNPDSDIDLAIFSKKKEINVEKFEKKMKRNVQLFWFKSIKDIKNKDLANNIVNGYVLYGKVKL